MVTEKDIFLPAAAPAEVVIRVVFENAPTHSAPVPKPRAPLAPKPAPAPAQLSAPPPKPTPVLVPRVLKPPKPLSPLLTTQESIPVAVAPPQANAPPRPPPRLTDDGNLFALWMTETDASANTSLEKPAKKGTLPAMQAAPQEAPYKKKPSKVGAGIASLFYYSFLIALVVGAFFIGAADPTGPPRNVFGYSFMTVLTRSMQDTLPQNSLIITRQVEANTIRVGDDLAFIRQDGKPIVHRVINVIPEYQNTWRPGFQTQGTMSPEPDGEIVAAVNVVGVVIFHSLFLGNAIMFIQQHSILIMLFVIFACIIVYVMKKLLFWGSPCKTVHDPPLKAQPV